mmetsp:Transcript_285/g.763  ORF Transcript_285/g.763 Transcript_285/m.763 type:complete len:254 (-) Transcript_285:997-1758(-)
MREASGGGTRGCTQRFKARGSQLDGGDAAAHACDGRDRAHRVRNPRRRAAGVRRQLARRPQLHGCKGCGSRGCAGCRACRSCGRARLLWRGDRRRARGEADGARRRRGPLLGAPGGTASAARGGLAKEGCRDAGALGAADDGIEGEGGGAASDHQRAQAGDVGRPDARTPREGRGDGSCAEGGETRPRGGACEDQGQHHGARRSLQRRCPVAVATSGASWPPATSPGAGAVAAAFSDEARPSRDEKYARARRR